MSILGRFDERIRSCPCPTSSRCRDGSSWLSLLGLQHRLAAERGDLHRVLARAIEQAVLDALIHLGDEVVDALRHEILARQERIAREERPAHRAALAAPPILPIMLLENCRTSSIGESGVVAFQHRSTAAS